MEAMGVLGFIFVLAGLSDTTKAKNDIAKLKEEFEDLRTLIEYSKKSAKNDLTE